VRRTYPDLHVTIERQIVSASSNRYLQRDSVQALPGFYNEVGV